MLAVALPPLLLMLLFGWLTPRKLGLAIAAAAVVAGGAAPWIVTDCFTRFTAAAAAVGALPAAAAAAMFSASW
jgi:hypothetical protein